MSKYIVWSPEAYEPPTKTFSSEKTAENVAKKMAATYPSQTFYACKIVGCAKADNVTYTKESK